MARVKNAGEKTPTKAPARKALAKKGPAKKKPLAGKIAEVYEIDGTDEPVGIERTNGNLEPLPSLVMAPRVNEANKVTKRTQKDKDFKKYFVAYHEDKAKGTKKIEFKRSDGGKLEKGFEINENGAIVEKLNKRQESKMYNFTKATSHQEEPVSSEKLIALRVADIRQFLNNGTVAKSQVANAMAVIRAYEEGGGVCALEGVECEELDKKDKMTYWYMGEQIHALKALTMRTDNEVWMEPKAPSRPFAGVNTISGAAAPGTENEPPAPPGVPPPPPPPPPPRPPSPGPVLPPPPGIVPSWDDEVLVYPWHHGVCWITLALRYPPSCSVDIPDPNAPGPRHIAQAYTHRMVFDTGCSVPQVSQHVIDELNCRQTYLGPRHPVYTVGATNVSTPKECIRLQYCILFAGYAVNKWSETDFGAPVPAAPGQLQRGYEDACLMGQSLNIDAGHFLLPRYRQEVIWFNSWQTAVDRNNEGYINLF